MSRPLPLLFLALSLPLGAASPFGVPEQAVRRSPAAPLQRALGPGESVADLDASPAGGEVAVLAGGRVRIWSLVRNDLVDVWRPPKGVTPKSVTWHPAERALFVLVDGEKDHQIMRLSPSEGGWSARLVYGSPHALRRLVAGPRPFLAEGGRAPRTRLFFGEEREEGTYAMRSVTEDGRALYTVAGPEKTKPKGEFLPSEIQAASALPLGFHPAGHLLLFEDAARRLQVARYERDHWASASRLYGGRLDGSSVIALPNGLGVLRWAPGARGAEIVIDGGGTSLRVAADASFTTMPSAMPDGRGLAGATAGGLRYEPVSMPLGDVANAWMFVEGAGDRERLERDGGLFRPLEADQLHSLYDSELYQCGGYGASTPTRPYLVTTDVMWEVFAAAYEGLFVVTERQRALPAFRRFVGEGAEQLERAAPGSRWARAFAVARSLVSPASRFTEPLEIAHVQAALDVSQSPILGADLDYREMKPRGHYAASKDLSDYFRAFRYLVELGKKAEDLRVLQALHGPAREAAGAWIRAYEPFIAPPRAPLVLGGLPPSPWASHPSGEPLLFPLSWGFDNEVLDTTVFHAAWAADQQIKGPDGPRLLSSALDVAAALGSPLARTLLDDEVRKYPPLVAALDELAKRHAAPHRADSLYERWIETLAVQWADDVTTATEPAGRELWRAKRLQTGLASWATLRHATVLVNERSAAECGEGGFEEIVLRPPRGAVEPDPKTFRAIALLFEAAAAVVERGGGELHGTVPAEPDASGKEGDPLRAGILRRLAESAAKARLFGAIAERELTGGTPSPEEYEEILYVGRVAEHHFLVYQSLAREDLALSNPEPMAKVADVAGNASTGYLLAGVGAPLEWDVVVPFYGRRQVVKGAAYSFYEKRSLTLLDDAGWREGLANEARPAWIEPFVARDPSSCPAKDPF